MFIAGVNDTGNKLFTGVNDAGDLLLLIITGVADTSDQALFQIFVDSICEKNLELKISCRRSPFKLASPYNPLTKRVRYPTFNCTFYILDCYILTK